MAQLLVSDRIRLCALDLDRHLPYLYEWENDSDAWTSSGVINPLSKHFVRTLIVQSATSIVEHGRLSLAIETLDGLPLGHIQLIDYDPLSQRAGVGIYLASQYRRQGYGGEALSLLADYASERLGCTMLHASTTSNNLASRRLFDTLGYTHTATLPRWVRHADQWYDLMYYQLWLKS